ncbi:xanthine dehydrogenase small subunit [Alsobacter metallidurans]|uniref:Xanthine dehydrogenase small subunit n=1 Tax=Alsobacter metallidurans TaxID=340221 RepID=A0A917I4K1_9HYPH|nr:xanthine dehydrogenase small subunit [Alsobacter metallidurans]GGH14095.1 xanthine dehydrogenase small subunit [Alsobacter metallidurans]
MTRSSIRFVRRGRVVQVDDFAPRTTLLDWLRIEQRLVGTKEGCGEGDCGACTVVLGRERDGKLVYEPVNACILLLGQIDGAKLITVEDLAPGAASGSKELHPVQAALVARHGSQCGFCTPGIVMSLFALYHEGVRPVTREAACDALAGNLCRCTGYRPIIDAALDVCAEPAADGSDARADATLAMLRRLDDAQDVFVGDEDAFFAAPASEESLAALLAEHPEATLLGGATDVGLWLTKALAPLRKFIWLGRVHGLGDIHDSPEVLALGATVSHARALEPLAAIDPDIGEVMRRFGSNQVRASGTVGGNIANGSPIGDLAPMLIVLGAHLELRGGSERRTLPLENFFLAYRKQDRRKGEFIRSLLVPKPGPGDHVRVFKVTKRFDEDISSLLMAMRVTIQGERIVMARVAFGGMAATPKRALAVETALLEQPVNDGASWAAAGEALASDFAPLDDHRASAAYRLQVGKNLIVKALAEIAGAPSSATRIIGHRETAHAAE